jgi:hypothetical protein
VLLSKAGYAAPSSDDLVNRFAAVSIASSAPASAPVTTQSSQPQQGAAQQMMQPMMYPQEMYMMPAPYMADGSPSSQAYYGGFDPSMMQGRIPMGYQQQGMHFNPAMYGGQPFYGRPMQGQFPHMMPPMMTPQQQPSPQRFSANVQPISRQFQAGPGETLIANKLFVGGLSYDLTEIELVQAFARYGAQKVCRFCCCCLILVPVLFSFFRLL